MGETKLQRYIFTILMCFLMVLGMTIYNVYLAIGASEHFLNILIKDFWLGFAIALLLDLFIVSGVAKGLAFSIIEKNRINRLPVKVLIISSFMVVGMVFFMSLYGAVKAVGFSADIFLVYPRIALMNFVVAWPLNLLVVNPSARLIHRLVFPVRLAAES